MTNIQTSQKINKKKKKSPEKPQIQIDLMQKTELIL